MAQNTQYDVVANFKAQGDLQKQVRGMTRQLPTMDRQLQRASQSMRNLGRAVEGSALRTAASWGAMGAKMTGVVAAVSGGMLIRGGLKFNRIMEDTRLEAATMFQMFKLSEGQIGKNASHGARWAQNLKNADFVMQGLFKVAKKTPASFQQVTTTYKGMAAGITLATTDLRRQLKFMESVSLLGGLAGGDYTVLGAQMGRILAGSAGAEMNIWKVISKPILDAGQSMKLFNKQMQIGGNLTKAFNELSSPERLAILEKAMSSFGEEMKQAYAQSMAGIVSTTQSQLQILMGMGTKPLYEGFRKWLIGLNAGRNLALTAADRRRAQQAAGVVPGHRRMEQGKSDREGVFSEYNMRRWSVLFATLGMHLGRLGQRMMDGLERAGFYILDNWPAMMDSFRRAWDYGLSAMRMLFTVMITRMVAGKLIGGAGMAMGAGAGLLGGLRSLIGFSSGPKGKKFKNRMDNTNFMVDGPWRILRNMAPLAAHAGKLALAFGVLLPLFAAIGVVIAGISVVAAGAAAYIARHWQELLAKVQSGEVVFTKLLQGWTVLQRTLESIGKSLLGGDSPGDALQNAINGVGTMFRWLARQLGPILDKFAEVVHLYSAGARFDAGAAERVARASAARRGQAYAPTEAVRKAQAEVAYYDRLEASLLQMGGAAAAAAEQKITPKEQADIDRKSLALREAAAAEAAKGAAKGTNVNIQNVIVNQDLRGLDPDRVFASFLPALERVANQRTQAHGMVPQGA